MNLDDAIVQLEIVIAEVRIASLNDDKTRLSSFLALKREAQAINAGASSCDVIVFGDLTDFKQLNDEWGHDAGDTGINAVGEILYELVIEQARGKAFRQSGDEFVLLFSNDQFHGFLANASKLSTITFSHNRQSLKTSLSLGYVQNDGRTEFSELLARAESACQLAKTQGAIIPVQWTQEIVNNPLLRRSARCKHCDVRIICNIPSNTSLVMKCCPCCEKRFED
jgi:diguanylate cyclase (GGDEF)-like protein